MVIQNKSWYTQFCYRSHGQWLLAAKVKKHYTASVECRFDSIIVARKLCTFFYWNHYLWLEMQPAIHIIWTTQEILNRQLTCMKYKVYLNERDTRTTRNQSCALIFHPFIRSFTSTHSLDTIAGNNSNKLKAFRFFLISIHTGHR